MRRCLLGHGWFENNHSSFFDLKWVYSENLDDLKVLNEGQYYNHFKNTKELTTKVQLIMNLKNCPDHEIDMDHFFPRAYDLGNTAERDDFQKEYQKTSLLVLLKKVVKYSKQKRPKLIRTLKAEILKEQALKKENQYLKDKKLSRYLHRKPKKTYKSEDFTAQNQEKDFKLNIFLICGLLSFLSDYKHQTEGFIEETETQNENLKRETLLKLIEFSKMEQGT